MKSFLLFLRFVLAACLCSLGCCQDMQQVRIHLQELAVEKIDGLSRRLEEIQNGMNTIKGSHNALERKVEEILMKMESLEGQMSESHRSSNADNLLEIFTGILEMERELQQEFMNRTCSRDQIAEMQRSLSNEFQASNDVISKCASSEEVSNLKELFETDVDECRTGRHRCHTMAYCTNTIGNYTCTCHRGYSGDGYTCKAKKCESPARVIDGLGCITPMKVATSWDKAKQNCQDAGSRLVEGITSQEQMDQLKEYFHDYLGHDHAWVGLYRWSWIEAGDAITPESLWGSDQPNRGDQECGYIKLAGSRALLGDTLCIYSDYSLCQF